MKVKSIGYRLNECRKLRVHADYEIEIDFSSPRCSNGDRTVRENPGPSRCPRPKWVSQVLGAA